MNIVHVVRQFSPSVGGLESAVLSLAQRQVSELGLAPRIVTLDSLFGQNFKLPIIDEVGGVPVRRLPWRGTSRYPLAPQILAHLHGADIVHVHAIDFFFDFLALTAPLHRRRLVATTHGGIFHTTRFAAAKKLWFNTITRASAHAYQQIVACSQSDFDLFQNAPSNRLVLIENGIDIDKFAGAASANQTRTIIYFGRFAEHKRVPELFPVLAALRKLHPAWRLIIAGGEAGQTIHDLQSLAEQEQIAGAITIEEKPTDQRLRDLIGAASFFGCLSHYEGFGLAAVEAMSAGLLPVLSGIPPFLRLQTIAPEIVIAGSDTPAIVAQTLEAKILSDTENAARKFRFITAANRYDWRHVARQYTQVYDSIIDRRLQTEPVNQGSRV